MKVKHLSNTADKNFFKSTPGRRIQDRALKERVLALTGAFETGELFPECFAALGNNFDGQGISFGVLQWNFGQNSLQPLLRKMNCTYPGICKEALGFLYTDFERMLNMNSKDQLAWSKSIQYIHVESGKTRWSIDTEWTKAFKALGLTDEMICIETEAAGIVYKNALSLASDYQVSTERGVALMFDILTQNGKLDKNGAGSRIKDDFRKISNDLSMEDKQVEKMKIIAIRRAEVCSSSFSKDVLDRKLTIAQGKGVVHSRFYKLDRDFNITLKSVQISEA
ncbi:MAG: peptidoglycan-binding protein [Bacteroidota bacterium]|nr:peptidoglycan-binding protein [Bacteroidota bacterium]MDP4193151.1 peptidoglycan-binding protein [Bacteroidota bacterium]MDP4197292.1 peptidoglycan-binding protein [Bacteroidota bacterium]